MGYCTRMIIVRGEKNGWQEELSRINLGKVSHNTCIGALTNKLQMAKRCIAEMLGLDNRVRIVKQAYDYIFNAEGNYNPEVKALDSVAQNKLYTNTYYKPFKALVRRFPYIFVDGKESFTDGYGDPLIITSLKDVITALEEDAQGVLKDDPDIPVALAMLKLYADKEKFGKRIRVVLYGN